jgi:hypothetical protein
VADPKHIDTVFLVGSGAEEGSWDPVCEAIRSLDIEGLGSPKTVWGGEAANTYFCLLVTGLRQTYLAGFPEAEKIRPAFEEAHRTLKRRIADCLRAGCKENRMRLRPEFVETARTFWSVGSCAFLTTNWDPLLKNWVASHGGPADRVKNLHGEIDDPDHLLMPSEMMQECYRKPEDELVMTGLAKKWGAFEAARRLVIYGHSLSPLESGLLLTLFMGFSKAPGGEILIVNRKGEMERVAERLTPLLPPDHKWRLIFKTVGA